MTTDDDEDSENEAVEAQENQRWHDWRSFLDQDSNMVSVLMRCFFFLVIILLGVTLYVSGGCWTV